MVPTKPCAHVRSMPLTSFSASCATLGRPRRRASPRHVLRLRAGLVAAVAVVGAANVGCGDDGGEPPPEDPSDALLELLAVPCEADRDAVYGPVPTPDDWTASRRGELIACAFDRRVTTREMARAFDRSGSGFVDPGLTTDVEKLRILYWTERFEGQPVLSSAAVYVPLERRGAPSPVVVLGHGSVGVDDRCAPSREHPDGFDTDWKSLVYTYVADGWLTVVPDFPGLGTPGLTTWMFSPDEGHSVLDATRAIRQVLRPDAVAPENALIGHSNGGHAVLSAQAYAGDYGLEGTLETVVVINPFWLSNALWGVLITPVGAALGNDTLYSTTTQYFAGHLAAWEGEDAAYDAFRPELREPMAGVFGGGCWSEVTSTRRGPPSVGAEQAPDLFTEAYVDEVGECALREQCDTPLAETWLMRWAVDRPQVDPDIPIVHVTGAQDDFVTPNAQQCGIDRLEADGGDLELCVEPTGNHSSTVSRSAGWVRRHLAARLLGEPDPDPCPGQEAFDAPPECDVPVRNGLEPGTP